MISNDSKPRTAYILQIHKNPDQVNKFIKQIISHEQADVYIHMDKKNYEKICKKISKSPSVFILQESVDIKWGDISMVDATLLLLKKVVDSGKTYDFVCLRSGQDLLVKNGFKDYLLKNKNKIFMTAYHVSERESHGAFVNTIWPAVTRGLYENTFHPYRIFRRGIMYLYGIGLNLFPNPNRLPTSYPIYNGSQWFCIPLNVAQYIVSFVEHNKWYYEAFENSLCPDEFFFQTLIMNSEFKSDVVNNNLMFIRFGDSLKSRNNPITLKKQHINSIKYSDKYFARKFDPKVDKEVIDYFSNEVRM
ncbi:beta-1,6-N-acetylglucosaminyltransferase [Neobacillus drentensis]|uniref:beta-1,6-N-acetylglucosaminyltransferase n=1 Tax=Neobacillus drentensis TaxID=220684 RepID=UPI00286489C0|nr:beta-1,6-N-acetylglucosaminyltransferase [Neobacillus drentensis]MDR7239962.1 hypothetical protein [Neobacillus drentensis]